jgi:hypothetical protein
LSQSLNDAQRKFLLIRRLSVVWKVVTVVVVLVVLYLLWGGGH